MNSLKYNQYNQNNQFNQFNQFNQNNQYNQIKYKNLLLFKNDFINIYQLINKYIDLIPDNEKAYIKDLNLYDENIFTKNNFMNLLKIYHTIKYIIN